MGKFSWLFPNGNCIYINSLTEGTERTGADIGSRTWKKNAIATATGPRENSRAVVIEEVGAYEGEAEQEGEEHVGEEEG